jgi:hypothetical protein
VQLLQAGHDVRPGAAWSLGTNVLSAVMGCPRRQGQELLAGSRVPS